MTFTRRIGLGRNLTAAEVDANFDSKTTTTYVDTALEPKADLQSGALASDSTAAPNAAAVVAAINAAVSGTVAAVPTSYASAIALDLVQGRDYGSHQVTTSETITVAGGAVQGGNAKFCLIGDGTHTPDLTAFTNANSYSYTNTSGFRNIYASSYEYSTPLLLGVAGTATDVTPPTLSTAAVPSNDAHRIDLTWSEPINSTVSASSAFAVSAGHTITAHTYVDATHTYLTVTQAFTNGETARTLAYTKPGSNNMKDLAGNEVANFSGTAVTNNTPAAATLTISHVTSPVAIDFTASGDGNYVVINAGSNSPSANLGAKGTNVGSFSAYGSGTDNNTLTGCTTISFSDATSGSSSPTGGNGGIMRSRIQTNAGVEAGVQSVCVADTTQRVYRVYCAAIEWSGNNGIACRAILGDGSVSTQTDSFSGSGTTPGYFLVTVGAASAGQTVTLQLYPATSSSGAQYAFGGIVEI